MLLTVELFVIHICSQDIDIDIDIDVDIDINFMQFIIQGVPGGM